VNRFDDINELLSRQVVVQVSIINIKNSSSHADIIIPQTGIQCI